MEDSVKVLIDGLIEQAKAEAKVLADLYENEGQIELPQVLVEFVWANSLGEEFTVAIVLNMSHTDIGKQLGMTSLDFYTFYDGKYMIDYYMAGLSSTFAETVASEEFRKETEIFIANLTAGDGKGMKKRIQELGTLAIQSFVIPETIQMSLYQLPSDCAISVGGVILEGVDAILDYVRTQTDSAKPFIIERSQRFPCFDASDYAYEKRYYRNFLICHSKQEADMKIGEMKKLEEGSNFCLVHKSLPADMRPMVYYQDEKNSMLLAF